MFHGIRVTATKRALLVSTIAAMIAFSVPAHADVRDGIEVPGPIQKAGIPSIDPIILGVGPDAGTVDIDDGDGLLNASEAGTGVPATWSNADPTAVSADVWFEDDLGNIPAGCGPWSTGASGTGGLPAACAAALPEGTFKFIGVWYNASAEASDPAEDTSVKDTVAPDAPVVSIDTDPINAANAASVSISGTAEAGSTVDVSLTGGATVTGSTGADIGDGTWSLSLDASSLTDGTVTASATATDAAGNTGAAGTDTALKDTVATLNFVTILDGGDGVVNGTESLATVIRTRGERGSTVDVSIDDTDGGTAPVTLAISLPAGAGLVTVNSAPVDISSLSDGVITATAVGTDAAGNTSPTRTDTAIKDATGPDAPVVSIDTDPINLSNVGTVDVSGVTEPGAAIAVTLSSGATVGQAGTADLVDGSFSFTFDASSLDDGTVTATAVATDAAGNDSAEGTDTALKDTVAPAAPAILTPGDNEGFPPGSTVLISGTSEPNASIELRPLGVVTPYGTVVADASGNWSFALAGLSEGHYVVVARQTDAAGNQGGQSFRSFDIDRNVPIITAPCHMCDNGASVTVSGTGKPGAVIQILEGSQVVGSTQVASSGNWSTQIGFSAGVHTIRARGLDGNQTPSAARTFTVEVLRPSVDIVAPSDGSILMPSDATTVSGTATDADDGVERIRLEYFDARGIKVAQADAVCTGCQPGGAGNSVTWTHTPALGPGYYSVVAQAIDTHGTRGRTDAHQFVRLPQLP